ncbi:MAG: hypothetical protein ACTSUE_23965 [Promethearchaeota archaeon]
MGGYGSDYDFSDDVSVTRKSAKSYNIDKNREYKETKQAVPPPKGKVLITKARFPVVVAVDVTGSMREYPGIIFEKLCILYNEIMYFIPEALKEHFEISFAAIGDAYTDGSPIQITDFGKGAELDMNINSLYPEGGGGGQSRETYELLAYYYSRKCNMINALDDPKPLFIFVGDEGFYSRVNRQHIIDLVGDNPKSDLISEDIFTDLKAKFDTYILRLRYRHDKEEAIDKMWKDVLGESKVIMMKEPRRVVDVIIGIVAAAVDGFDAFKERIEIRQTKEQVEQVYDCLNGIESDSMKKKYVYQIAVLECPRCGSMLKEMPDYGKPCKCESCGYLIVRI